LGYHVLAVAPANDNVNKLAKDLHEHLEFVRSEVRRGKNLRHELFDFLRLFPGSRDLVPEEMDEEQARHRKVGHKDGDVLPFKEFLVALEQQGKEKLAHREHGVAETIVRLAMEKKTVVYRTISHGKYIRFRSSVNAYDELRKFIDLYHKDEVPWQDEVVMGWYKGAYEACKARLIEQNRILITTNGNIRARENLDYWFPPASEGGAPRQGVIIIGDEGPIDVEVNTWVSIVCYKWSDWVEGVALFGDDK
jgi:hypothetical protein